MPEDNTAEYPSSVFSFFSSSFSPFLRCIPRPNLSGQCAQTVYSLSPSPCSLIFHKGAAPGVGASPLIFILTCIGSFPLIKLLLVFLNYFVNSCGFQSGTEGFNLFVGVYHTVSENGVILLDYVGNRRILGLYRLAVEAVAESV